MVSEVETQFVVSSSLAQKLAMDVQSGEFAQMLNGCGYHWFTISTVAVSKESANMFVSIKNKEEIVALLCTPKIHHTSVRECAHQVGSNDYDL